MFEALKARQSEIWSSAPWQDVAGMLAPAHEHLVQVLDPQAGQRWLDVATGTGAVALRAARAGADVTGVDFAPSLIETARRQAAAEGLSVHFDVGDAEDLPYADGAFDAVSSTMGLIFAPDHEAVAGELARVCRPRGTAAFTAWRAGATFRPVTQKYAPPLEPGQGDSEDWGREEYAEQLLGQWFDVSFEEGDAPLESSSGEEAWRLLVASAGPFKARAESLEPAQREALHTEFVDFVEQNRLDGGVRVPGPYLLVIARRR